MIIEWFSTGNKTLLDDSDKENITGKVVPKELVPQIIVPFCKTAIAWKEVCSQVSQANFNLKEISADNSAYVAQIAEKLVAFTAILDRIDRNISISAKIRGHIWVRR